MWTDNEHVWALRRQRPEGSALFLANFSEEWQSVQASIIVDAGLVGHVRNLVAPETELNESDGRRHLAPYESLVLIGDD